MPRRLRIECGGAVYLALPAADLIEVAAVRDFVAVADQSDDFTALAVRYLGRG